MTPAGRLRLAGLAWRASRGGMTLIEPGQIPEGLYTAAGFYVDICPKLPDEVDVHDDDAIDAYMDFALDSESLMLDAVERQIAWTESGRRGNCS